MPDNSTKRLIGEAIQDALAKHFEDELQARLEYSSIEVSAIPGTNGLQTQIRFMPSRGSNVPRYYLLRLSEQL